MKLENQVCSLDLAKRLKELGVKQESLWWWCVSKLNNSQGVHLLTNQDAHDPRHNEHFIYSAFTVAELGEMLPYFVYSKRTVQHYVCIYRPTKHREYDTTEANARAKMVIYLKEKGLMK